MKYKTCCFFGHSELEICSKLKNEIKSQLIDLLNQGYANFLFGGFGMFDKLCWQITSELKKIYPYIKRIYCLSDERHIRISKRPACLHNDDYEEFVFLPLSFDWWYKRIYFRNCEMINLSDFTIFYVNTKKNSGAYKIMQYARKRKQDYINFGTLKD